MADIIAAVRFEKALQMMNSDLSWRAQGRESEIETYLDIALGFQINKACSSYWVSPKGLILENFGSIQGGYSGDYGIAALKEMSQLAEFAEAYYGADSKTAQKYRQRVMDSYTAADYFMFTANAGIGGDPTLYAEGLTSNRNSYYPGTERYVLDTYAAVACKNNTALKMFDYFIRHNRLERTAAAYTPANVHFEDNSIEVMELFFHFDSIAAAIAEQDIAQYDFLMENDAVNSCAWADEMGRNVVIKNGGDKIYIALNWRNPIHSKTYYNTAGMVDQQKGLMNNLARIHHKTDSYDKYGYAAVATKDWTVKTAEKSEFKLFTNHYVDAFMYMNYGKYTVLMNSNNLLGNETDISYEIPAEELELHGLYKDLISGKYYAFGETITGAEDGTRAVVAPATTMVLCSADSVPFDAWVDKVAYTDHLVRVSFIACGTAGSRQATVYIAEYNSDGVLDTVAANRLEITETGSASFAYEKRDAQNTIAVLVWDGHMQPFDTGMLKEIVQ